MKIKTNLTLEALEISADEWELYTASYPKDCEWVAGEINCTIAAAVNRGATREEAEKATLAVMRKWEDRGAMDSEPLAKLTEVLDRIYGQR